jgi:hypothetical protein
VKTPGAGAAIDVTLHTAKQLRKSEIRLMNAAKLQFLTNRPNVTMVAAVDGLGERL